MNINAVCELKKFAKDNNTAVYITSEENNKYFTGFASSNGYLIVTAETSFFLTDSRYIEAAGHEISVIDEILETKGFEKTIVPLFENMGIKRISIEQSRTTIDRLIVMKKLLPFAEIITDNSLDKKIDGLRSVKCEEELKAIAKAQEIAEKAFNHILGFIKPGITEKDVSLELDFFMLKNGAEALSFETIAVAGANGSKPHGVPGDYVLCEGDFVTMDFGAVWGGYHSDMTRTVAVGEVSEEMRLVYETVLKAQKAGLDKIKAGASCKEVDAAARQVITDAGFGKYFGHGFGHGVGIEIHESPYEGISSTAFLEKGNVVTAEPGIYIPGKFGVRIEDMVCVTEDGYRNFTKCEKELIVINNK